MSADQLAYTSARNWAWQRARQAVREYRSRVRPSFARAYLLKRGLRRMMIDLLHAEALELDAASPMQRRAAARATLMRFHPFR